MRTQQKVTIVPGARVILNAHGVPARDKKGRVLWEMPQPTSYVLHTKRGFRGKGKTKVVLEEKIEVPVYRGFDASLVRNVKSALRRKRIKEAKHTTTKALKVEVPDNLMEEEDA